MDATFSASLTQAILRSDRRRVFIIAVVLLCAMCGFLLVTGIEPTLLERLFHGKVQRAYVAAFLFTAAVVEYGVARHLDHLVLAASDLNLAARLLHTFLEVTTISCVFVFEFQIFPPVVALTVPTIFGYFLLLILSTLRLDFWQSVWTGAVASLEYLALALYAIHQPLPPGTDPMLAALPQHLGKAGLLFVAGGMAGLVGAELRRQIATLFRTQQDRQRVLDVFGRHVSPSVVNKLLEQPTELSSEVRHVCVMFLDIRNFTTFSERRTPAEVVAFLNTLFGFMIEEINRHQGIINKFLGDGFMAVFGAPITDGRDCRNAVEASRAILAKLDEMVKSGAVPPTRVGIGLHAGEAVTGTVGSPERKEYTVIGDVVNLASRIESLNKELNAQVLASDAVVRDIPDLTTTPRGPMKVKGREEPVQIHQIA